MTAHGVAESLTDLFTTRGVPRHVRGDNGPEFTARTIRRLAELTGVETLYIASGSPWENGYAESFHSRLRDELLNAEVFTDVRDAKALAAPWRHEYNHHRPHSSLGYRPPRGLRVRVQGEQSVTLTHLHPRNPDPKTLIAGGTENGGRADRQNGRHCQISTIAPRAREEDASSRMRPRPPSGFHCFSPVEKGSSQRHLPAGELLLQVCAWIRTYRLHGTACASPCVPGLVDTLSMLQRPY